MVTPLTAQRVEASFISPTESNDKESDMKTDRKPLSTITGACAALICLALQAPSPSFAAAKADSVERWNIAMTDFSAGLPPPGLPPFVEARAYAMAHIAMLHALRVATRPVNAGSTNVDASIAAAAHDVLDAEFGKFIGPDTPFDGVYATELRYYEQPRQKPRYPHRDPRPLQCSRVAPTKM